MKRILEVVGRMDRAGQETFLMNVLRSHNPQEYEITFSVNTFHKGDYEDEIEQLGGHIWHNPYPASIKHLRKYLNAFRKFLINNGPFDVIHCHVYLFSGFILQVARQVGIPIRVMHSHSTSDGYKNTISRIIYRKYTRFLIKKHATKFVACGRDAYKSFFGQDAPDDNCILNNAILPEKYMFTANQRNDLRKQLGIDINDTVIINIARFCKVKNHEKIISTFKMYFGLNPNAVLLLVGNGELRKNIENICYNLGIYTNVKFLGIREDIPLLLNTSDVLLMPSLFEGLPVTLIEAQAAGIPCVISDTITQEIDMGLNIVRYVPLDASDQEWAETISKCCAYSRCKYETRMSRLRSNGYTIDATWNKLKKLYDQI